MKNNKQSCAPKDIMLQAAMFRLGNIDEEVRQGFEILRKHHKTVTVFGSARLKEDSEYYQAAKELCGKLAKENYTVVSGGGNGIMGAANRGAYEAGGESIGFNIYLPFEQKPNKYTTDEMCFHHFAPRKIVMTLYANAYIYFPGGFGTLDELSEILTLVQTGKTIKAPIILFGSKFWSKLDHFITSEMRDHLKLISPGDEKLYTIVDDINEVVELVKKNDTYCEH